MSTPPYSPQAEESVVGQMLSTPRITADVIATALEPGHFYSPPMRGLFHEILSAYYADEPIDALTIAESAGKTLARAWKCTDEQVVENVRQLAAGRSNAHEAIDHARIVKRHADLRALLDIAAQIERDVALEERGPEEIAGVASQSAMQVATSTLLTSDIVAYEDLGRNFVQTQRQLMSARDSGLELGAYFGLSFIDSYTRGLRPTELMFLAGDPGAGKSAVSWFAAQVFAERQMKKPENRRIGTLVLSLEMAEEPSSTRLAQAITGIDGGKLREGRTEQEDLERVIAEWRKRRDLPLYFNFTSNMRTSQLKAVIVEAIRRYNVGLVIIDHLKYVDMDGRWRSSIEEEGAKARFLKQDIATQLNVAVICLAHTSKAIDTPDRRPRLQHLRGSQEIAAHADFVAMVYRPFSNASQDDIDDGRVSRTDAELIFVKNRHGMEGTSRFHFDAASMVIY